MLILPDNNWLGLIERVAFLGGFHSFISLNSSNITFITITFIVEQRYCKNKCPCWKKKTWTCMSIKGGGQRFLYEYVSLCLYGGGTVIHGMTKTSADFSELRPLYMKRIYFTLKRLIKFTTLTDFFPLTFVNLTGKMYRQWVNAKFVMHWVLLQVIWLSQIVIIRHMYFI